jgi:hypothetical protein
MSQRGWRSLVGGRICQRLTGMYNLQASCVDSSAGPSSISLCIFSQSTLLLSGSALPFSVSTTHRPIICYCFYNFQNLPAPPLLVHYRQLSMSVLAQIHQYARFIFLDVVQLSHVHLQHNDAGDDLICDEAFIPHLSNSPAIGRWRA